MRLLLLIALVSLVSCGQENQTKEEKLAFQRQSLVESGIQCAEIKTDLIKEKISCPTSLIAEEAMFLFSIDKEFIDQEKLNRKAKVSLKLFSKKRIQGYFFLISKHGKRLSDDVLFDGLNTLTFEELRVGDFSAHDVYLKLINYHTGGNPVPVETPIDRNCDTGFFNVEDINLESLRGQCPNLKVLSNLKAEVLLPVYDENENFDMTDSYCMTAEFGFSTPFGSGYTPPAQCRVNYRINKGMQLQQVDALNFFSVESNQFGLVVEENVNEVCEVEGILSLQVKDQYKKWNEVSGKGIRLTNLRELSINGRYLDLKSSYQMKKCYPVVPKLVGTLLIKE